MKNHKLFKHSIKQNHFIFYNPLSAFRPSLQKSNLPESTNTKNTVNKEIKEESEVDEIYDEEGRKRDAFSGIKLSVFYFST